MIRGFRTVLVSKSSALDYSLGNINIRNSDGTIKINLNEIHTIILENTQSNLTSFLIKELIERNIAVIFCDEKHLPIGELSPLYGNYESSKKLREQINFSDELKLGVWTLITKEDREPNENITLL